MKKTDSELEVQCDLSADLPMLPEELKLLQDLLPEVVKAMACQLVNDEE